METMITKLSVNTSDPKDVNTEPQSITKETLPLLLSAKDVNKIGISRSMFYRLIHMENVPTILLGERKYIHRDRFFTWLEANIESIN